MTNIVIIYSRSPRNLETKMRSEGLDVRTICVEETPSADSVRDVLEWADVIYSNARGEDASALERYVARMGKRICSNLPQD